MQKTDTDKTTEGNEVKRGQASVKATGGKRFIKSLVRNGKLHEYANSQYALNVFFLKGTFDEYKAVVSYYFGKEMAESLGNGETYCALTLRSQLPGGAYCYAVWLQDVGPETLVNAVHECVHATGFALADCNLPTDIENEQTSESVAYLTADMFRFVVSRLYPDLGVSKNHELLGEFKDADPTKTNER